MKNIFRLFLTALLLNVSSYPLFAQWLQTNGPNGGLVNCLVASGTNIFAGTDNGVYLSTNNGTSWTAINTGLTNTEVRCLAISDTNIFAGTNNGVYHSTNNGASWTLGGYANVNCLAFSGDKIFAGTSEHGLIYSTNNGRDWFRYWNLPVRYISSIAVSSTNIFAGTNSGVYLSTNNGENWNTVNSGLTDTTVLCLVTSGTNLFVVTSSGGVFRSTNNGTSWNCIYKNSIYINCIAVSGDNIFVGQGFCVLLSTNNGTSWGQTSLTNSGVRCLMVSGADVFAGTNTGIYRSTDYGTSWSFNSTGIANTGITSLVTSGNNLIAGITYSGIQFSSNNGSNWIDVTNGIPKSSFYALAVLGNNIFAGTGYEGLFRSTNNGTSWTEVGGYRDIFIYSLVTSGINLFVGEQLGVLLSTNNGTSFTSISNGLPDKGRILALAASGTNLFADAEVSPFFSPTFNKQYINPNVYHSTNGGANWINAGLGLEVFVRCFAISGNYVFAGSEVFGIYLSTNNGESWTESSTGLTSFDVRCFATIGTNLFAGTEGGVFLSTNNGSSWTQVNTGLTDYNIQSLAVSGTVLYAGTKSRGVWRRPLSEMVTSVEPSSKDMPADFGLEQNYPNPFNPSTTINYQLPQSGQVTIKVYDVLGNEVKTLVNEYKPAGNYTVNFDGSKLGSGMYIYRITAGGYTSAKKMTLIK